MTYKHSEGLLTLVNGRLEEIQAITINECKKTQARLKQRSPKATGELSNRWSVSATVTKVFGLINFNVGISNRSKAAFNRVVGRAPGSPPPTEAIRQWCAVKGIDPAAAYPIARTIGLKGTRRWQQESNVLNYRRSTQEYAVPNEWTQTIETIIQRCRQL